MDGGGASAAGGAILDPDLGMDPSLRKLGSMRKLTGGLGAKKRVLGYRNYIYIIYWKATTGRVLLLRSRV